MCGFVVVVQVLCSEFYFTPVEVTEGAILRDLIFVFQNIDGQYIQFDSHRDTFKLTNKVNFSSLLTGNLSICHIVSVHSPLSGQSVSLTPRTVPQAGRVGVATP